MAKSRRTKYIESQRNTTTRRYNIENRRKDGGRDVRERERETKREREIERERERERERAKVREREGERERER